MNVQIPKKITIQIDSREQYPITFPAHITIENPDNRYKKIIIPVKQEVVKLDAGDYRLREFPDCVVVERKGAVRELYTNLFNPKDQIRQAKAFRKLSVAEFPYLLIEVSPAEILSFKHPEVYHPMESLIHRLTLITAKYRIRPLWIPRARTARTTGCVILHLMLSHALQDLLAMPVSVPETIVENTPSSEEE